MNDWCSDCERTEMNDVVIDDERGTGKMRRGETQVLAEA